MEKIHSRLAGDDDDSGDNDDDNDDNNDDDDNDDDNDDHNSDLLLADEHMGSRRIWAREVF